MKTLLTSGCTNQRGAGHFQAAPAGEHTLSAIHYQAERSSSKKRILDDAPEHIIFGP